MRIEDINLKNLILEIIKRQLNRAANKDLK
jgi:hypothetical protein